MSETKKLYIVTFSAEVVVYAEDQRDAMMEARDALRSGDISDLDEPETAREMSYLPGGWEIGCIPYGADGDATIEDLIAAGAAPQYTEALAKLAAAKAGAK